jgi:hypothetical protein
MSIRDTRLAARALEQRWPVPDDVRAGLVRPGRFNDKSIGMKYKISEQYRDIMVKRLMKIIASPDSDDHNAINAAKVLQSLENDNDEVAIAGSISDLPEYSDLLGLGVVGVSESG